MRISIILAGAIIALTAPVAAQDAPPNSPDPAANAANANDAARAAVADRQTIGVRPEDQAAYDGDMAAYREQLRAHYDGQDYDAALAARNERAYANAMMAWRRQVRDCKHGHNRACRAPTPRPADYW